MTQTNRTWAEINLEHLADNYQLLRGLLADNCKLLAPVKADAYGHGAVVISKKLASLGADYLAVASLEEALHLRQHHIHLPILVFGYTSPQYVSTLVSHNITQAVYSLAYAKELSLALSPTKQTLNIHLELETGLGRLGFPALTGKPEEAHTALSLPHLHCEGIYTHFSVADTDENYTKLQAERFQTAVAYLERKGHTFPLKHIAGSAGMLMENSLHLNMVRPGIALYGISPNPNMFPAPLKPVMSLKTRIMQVHTCTENSFVSYGKTYQAKKGDTLAVLHIGYADGVPRILSGNMEVLLHGKKVPQVGRICMDMIVIDITQVPQAQMGDVVTIFGKDGAEEIHVAELSQKAGTIPYEILCGITARVPRV